MPSDIPITCIRCNKPDCLYWHKLECGKICNECFDTFNNVKTEEDDQDNSKIAEKVIRKSTRSTRYMSQKINPFAIQKTSNKGKGRRHIFKKKPIKTPTAVATAVTSDSIYYKGTYMQVGDIVSLTDTEHDVYYAQIRGFMTDEYCEKSAVITWLLPTTSSPPPENGFDPATYIIGPEEDFARKLECMEFIMHAPSDYFKSRTPYPPADTTLCIENSQNNGFIWTSFNPCERKDNA